VRVDDEVRGQLATRFEVLLPHPNERQQRLALACEARLLGHGSVAAVAAAARVSPTTVRRVVSELHSGEEPLPVGRASVIRSSVASNTDPGNACCTRISPNRATRSAIVTRPRDTSGPCRSPSTTTGCPGGAQTAAPAPGQLPTVTACAHR
jgi:hypothetical protein